MTMRTLCSHRAAANSGHDSSPKCLVPAAVGRFRSLRDSAVGALVLAVVTLAAPGVLRGDTVDLDATTCVESEEQVEGPYYLVGSPLRSYLVEPGDGPLLTITGRVLDTDCQPIPNCWVDVWHTDATGSYDLVSPDFRYRGHFYTDARGDFVLETIIPGLYPGRTPHLHVKVQGAGTPVLTTQLYIPDHPLNATDLFYTPLLELAPLDWSPGGDLQACFDFVLSSTCTAPTVQSEPEPASCPEGEPAVFSVSGTGSAPLSYQWWRDGVPLADSLSVSGSDTSTLVVSAWSAAEVGVYECRVTNACGEAGSTPVLISLAASTEFVRGDCTGDGGLDLADIVTALGLLFGGQEVACVDACDINDDAEMNIADAVYGLSFLFVSGPPPEAPFPGCGLDPTPDNGSCHTYEAACLP